MLGRLLIKSLWKRKSRTALVILSVATGAALVSAFLNIVFTTTEEIAKELRSFGANILLVPRVEPLEIEIGGLKYSSFEESASLEESDLPKLKTIFWRHNIAGFTPYLSRIAEIEGKRVLLVGTWFEKEIPIPEGKRLFSFASNSQREAPVERGTFRTGLRSTARWWRVEGRWVAEDEEAALLGSALARKLKLRVGALIRLSYNGRSASLPVRGIVQTGGAEEEQVFVPLNFAQEFFSLPGKVERVQVSALVAPDDALAIRAGRIGPSQLPPSEYETWYCTPYLGSIIHQLEEAIPTAKGKAIRQISEAEGSFLGKMKLTMVVLVAVALLVASLGVMATAFTAAYERGKEIGLMKALGAEGKQIALLFLLEGGVSGLFGGLVGYLSGLALTRLLAAWAFPMASPNLSLSLQGVILPVTLLVAAGMALLGSFFPVMEAAKLEPVKTLRGS